MSGFTVWCPSINRAGTGERLSANDENYSSEEGNALEISTHFSVFPTRADALDYIKATEDFRSAKGYDNLGPYIIEPVELVW